MNWYRIKSDLTARHGWPSWYGPCTSPFDHVASDDITALRTLEPVLSNSIFLLRAGLCFLGCSLLSADRSDVSSESPLVPYIISLSRFLSSSNRHHRVIWGRNSSDFGVSCSEGYEAIWRISDRKHEGPERVCLGVPMIKWVQADHGSFCLACIDGSAKSMEPYLAPISTPRCTVATQPT